MAGRRRRGVAIAGRASRSDAHELAGEDGGRSVPVVRQDDDPEPGRGLPAHVRAESRVAARVPDDPPEPKVVDDEEPESVAARLELGQPIRGRRLDRGRDGPVDLLHLAAGRSSQRMGCIRIVTRREGVGEPADPAGEVTQRRVEPAHRRERPVRIERLHLVRVVAPEVAVGEPLRRHGRLFERRRGHPERFEEALAGRRPGTRARPPW